MKFRPRTHLEDDVSNLLFCAIRTEGESPAVHTAKVGGALHAVFRTLYWEHGANYQAKQGAARVATWERLVDQADASGVAIDSSWDGFEWDAGQVRHSIEGFIGLLRVEFPEGTI